MREGLCVVSLALMCVLSAPSAAAVATAKPTAATAIAAKKAAVIAYLHRLQDRRETLAGVQVNEFEVYLDCTSAVRVEQMAGKPPALLGLELMNAIAVPPYGGFVLRRALEQSAAGGLVTLTWHVRNPTKFCVRGEYFDCTQTPMSDATMAKLLKPGTREHKSWQADVDAIAKLLKKLRDKGVVVLFRPYHEMNGRWFWWGDKDGYPQLWDALYERLAVHHKLDNLIWVWSGDRETPNAQRYAPLRHAPDVAGIDVYEPDADSPKYAEGRANLQAVFGAKMPFAITEVGHVPDAKTLDVVNPAWVLLWGGEYIDRDLVMKGECKDCNSRAAVAAFLKYGRIRFLPDMPAEIRAIIAGDMTPMPVKRHKARCPLPE